MGNVQEWNSEGDERVAKERDKTNIDHVEEAFSLNVDVFSFS
jgi:hypothetical protein